MGLIPQVNVHGRPMVRQATAGATEEKVRIVREAAGDRFERLELNAWLGDAGLVGTDGLVGSIASAVKSVPARAIGTPYVLYGTLGGARDVLLRRRDRLGISYYTIPGRAMEAMAPLVEALAGR